MGWACRKSQNGKRSRRLAPFFTPQYQSLGHVPEGSSIEFFFSLRSPYSAICCAKLFHWAKDNGVQVNLRYVLPMVMRGLPVPAEKESTSA